MAPKKKPVLLPESKAPRGLLFREVKPDWSGLFTKLSDFDLAKPLKLPSTLYSALLALFKLKPQKLGEEAFLLVQRALAGAVAGVIDSVVSEWPSKLRQVGRDAGTRLDAQLSREPVELTTHFFTYPGRARAVGTVARLLASWLRAAGLDSEHADAAVLTLPARFVARLNEELENHGENYPNFVKEHKTQFLAAAEEEEAWLRYHVQLVVRANPNVLNLGVSLEDVYVELRAYTEVAGGDIVLGRDYPTYTLKSATVGMLAEMSQAWMEADEDAIFVLSGGPGAGKSAFARRFAAWRAWTGPDLWRVLFVPLHRLKLGADLKPTLNDFASGELRHEVNLFGLKSDIHLLLVFDGLDELAQQGRVGEELAADFFRQVDDFVKDCNRDTKPSPVRVMLCGRPVAVSITNAEVRRAERVRHVLPYAIEDHRLRSANWQGQPDLIKIDQRDEWWTKYGSATGEPEIGGMPPDIRTEKLDPLTAEPILNGLIAECRKKHRITRDTNRAQIYEWLLSDVLKRVHDKSGKQHLKDAKEEDIAKLLEEVAVTAWHSGDVRATTKAKMQERCERTDQTELLNYVFPNQPESNITALFLAFYFQEAGERQGQDRAFEFSHKSFGEYLLARRIIRFVRDLSRRLDEGAWDGDVGVRRWAELFGPTPIDGDLWTFIRDIADLEPVQEVNSWRKSIIKLLNRVLKQGMPMNQLSLPDFQRMERQNRNAILSLFAVHSSCYRLGQTVFPADWVSKAQIGEILGQTSGGLHYLPMLYRHLRGMNFSSADFYLANLSRADFQGADLSNVSFFGCNMTLANLEGAILTKAKLSLIGLGTPDVNPTIIEVDTDLRGANLMRANLDGAMLYRARLDGARIEGADFTDAMVSEEQLLSAVGEPAIMANGKPPVKGWRTKRTRRTRAKNAGGATAGA